MSTYQCSYVDFTQIEVIAKNATQIQQQGIAPLHIMGTHKHHQCVCTPTPQCSTTNILTSHDHSYNPPPKTTLINAPLQATHQYLIFQKYHILPSLLILTMFLNHSKLLSHCCNSRNHIHASRLLSQNASRTMTLHKAMHRVRTTTHQDNHTKINNPNTYQQTKTIHTLNTKQTHTKKF